MLPSDEKAHFGDIVALENDELILIDGDLTYCGLQIDLSNGKDINTKYLYITSDEEIKEGDWFYYEAEKTIMQCTEHNFYFTPELIQNYSNVYKIIATTDKYITIDGYDSSDEDSIVKCYLPQPSKEFIEAYIKAYNKGNIITDVAVEYENTVRNRFGEVHIQTINDGEEYIKTTILISSILKVNPDNTINIKQSKDSWNRSEVVELCTKAVIYGFEHSDEDNNGNYDDRDNNETLLDMFVENFIKENL